MMTAALILACGLATADKDLQPLLDEREKLEMPGKGEPEYTDQEAAAFAARLAELNAGRDRKPPKTLKDALAELKIDPKKMRGGALHVGNATDWVEYRLSPSYNLSAAYTQAAPKETAFRDVRIIKKEPVKPT